MSNLKKNIFHYRKFWAKKFGIAPELPMSQEEMDLLGWDSCDVILVTGDAYVDHPSFGMAVIGRVLEAQGFRVGIISQPDWHSKSDFTKLGKPNLFWGVTAGNMDSMINRYTSDRKVRSNDAYTPEGLGGKRPDRSVLVYSQRCREAYKDVPLIIGGIEASLRRIAHYDYWSEKVRRSLVLDAKADLLVYGNGERQIVEIAHRLAQGEAVKQITDIRGTSFIRNNIPDDWYVMDSSVVDDLGQVDVIENPYQEKPSCESAAESSTKETQEEQKVIRFQTLRDLKRDRSRTVLKLPNYETVTKDPVAYAHASRVLHLETNPYNARALMQKHGDRIVWLNPPPLPLTTDELDGVFGLNYTRVPHPVYQKKKIPAHEMIQYSVNIMRGCFGGCTFCSITEHEGRIIQNRSENSVIQEIEKIRDKAPGFTGIISDLGGPTANMYRLGCVDPKIEASCRKPSCVYPEICQNLKTSHKPLIKLYQRARKISGVKKILIASGLRYDLAVRSHEYVKELVTHHVGGYLKIAPEHTEGGPLSKMMKPGMRAYYEFKKLFEKYSKLANKEQYLIPYFIAAHPGTSDEDMMNLAIWLKLNKFRADQVQTFLPSPMATASAMYYTGKNPLRKVSKTSESVNSAKGAKQRRLHKAFLRYHDANNWPLLREALKKMGRSDLIGNGKKHLIPTWQPKNTIDNSAGLRPKPGKKPVYQKFRTQRTSLPKKTHE
ncbi:UPF0313 [4Fe-4S] protein YgiQ [hydrothermal vent metagenome]|uniref:UPF0313 [4Fe-4S] protein YgiQ n=1 Tax=hydrothermal vent metagenome TaxID=652676 RepID=A0A3B1A132_9ZZZZ